MEHLVRGGKNPNMYSLCEASTLQRTEQNYVLSSSRLPQYDRLASLGQNVNYEALAR